MDKRRKTQKLLIYEYCLNQKYITYFLSTEVCSPSFQNRVPCLRKHLSGEQETWEWCRQYGEEPWPIWTRPQGKIPVHCERIFGVDACLQTEMSLVLASVDSNPIHSLTCLTIWPTDFAFVPGFAMVHFHMRHGWRRWPWNGKKSFNFVCSNHTSIIVICT